MTYERVCLKPCELYPTMGSIQDVLDLGRSKLPITEYNDLVSLLFTMQNTVLLLKAIEGESCR